MSRSPGNPVTTAKSAALEQYVTLVVKDDEGRELTRTMRRTDKLNVLMDFYYDLVPTVESGGGVFLLRRTRMRIQGWETPAGHGMKDGDVVLFLPDIKPGMLVTLVLQDFRGRSFTRTMRRTDRMQGLMDFYAAMAPADVAASDGVFLYGGERVPGEQTPAGLGMEDWNRVYFVPRRLGEVVVEDKSDDYITVKVRDDKERTFYSTMRRGDKLKSLMDMYYATVLGAEGNGAFLFDARQLRRWHTPAELEMEDGDEMDYLPSQFG